MIKCGTRRKVAKSLVKSSLSSLTYVLRNWLPSVLANYYRQILIHTIRLEIASCAARSYPSLPIASAKNLLFLASEGAVVEFAQEQGWSLEDGRIYFPGLADDSKKAEELGDQRETISNMVGYTRDLEMIV